VFKAQDGFAELTFLSQKELDVFKSLGMNKLEDLLGHFPKRYEDRRRFDCFPSMATSRPICLRAAVIDASTKRFGAGRGFYEAVLSEGGDCIFGSGRITCRWFNMPYIAKMIAVGQEVCFYGKLKEINGRLIIDHPEFEILGDQDEFSIHLERIVPIYKNLSGIPQRRLREILYQILLEIDSESLDPVYEVASATSRAKSLRDVHFPEIQEEADVARRRFALEDFFALQLNVLWRRARYREQAGRVLGRRTALLKEFHRLLPFDLTGAQKRAVREIIMDMRRPQPMNRLLQGDVGSGKTFVAMAAMLLAIDSGCQAALMAPTQILAEQHFLTFRRWLEPLGIRVALRTGSREESNHLDIEVPQMVIGTHALLYDRDLFRDLGFVVIDEQHKFGVVQRESLISLGMVPDVLVMTATPIPRSLTMTIYGDLDLSVLDEKPPGRGRIVTAVRVGSKQSDITKFVKSQLAVGRQAYLVYPLVDESDSLKIESATEAFEKWKKRLAGHQVGLIHGKLRPEEKEAVMRRFRDGEISALVSTTVIEVGVDVPNASLMILHHAERFGLAQLHQLRGRIGRGDHKGYCILLTDSKKEEALEKLKVLEETPDGFKIAEADLRLRGPGDLLGTVQSGISEVRFVEFLADVPLLLQARQRAEQVIAEDPRLDGIHKNLRALIQSGEQGTEPEMK
jgi:ATP-dependent DNA helicase RecG